MVVEGRVVTFGEASNAVVLVLRGKEAAKPDEKVAKMTKVKRNMEEAIAE